MIGYVTGVVRESFDEGEIVVETNGVGYAVTVTPSTKLELGPMGSTVSLHVYTRVREDAITLFGFITLAEKRMFTTLITARGVGPALALSILGTYTPELLRTIVATEDVGMLSQVPGVGKKTATRILLDLKDKLGAGDFVGEVDVRSDGGAMSGMGTARAEVLAALGELGYSGEEIRQVMSELPNDAEADAATLLRSALKLLAGAR